MRSVNRGVLPPAAADEEPVAAIPRLVIADLRIIEGQVSITDQAAGEPFSTDLAPIDLSDPDNATLMEAYVWTDQPIRFERLRAAIDLAQQKPPRVHRRG